MDARGRCNISRLIFIPQYPVQGRYQQWWFSEFPKQFKKYFDEVIVVGERYVRFNSTILQRGDNSMFSPIELAIDFETKQIKEYLSIELKHDDVLFLSDISFPGIFSNVLYHKRPNKCFAFCHATSLNFQDYFEKDRQSKFKIETGYSELFNKIFVGSKYHEKKLGWKNTMVTALPDPIVIKKVNCDKIRNIVSVCRPNSQKIDLALERKVEDKFGLIDRKMFEIWDNYSKFLSESKILLISSLEDTFNYTILDALKCGCIPLAPARLCFTEILTPLYLYVDENSLFSKIEKILNNSYVPFHDKVECQDLVDNFYSNICKEMLK